MSTPRATLVADLSGVGPDADAITLHLIAHSNLPGPRANLALADAFADWAPDALVDDLAARGDPRPAAGGDEFVDFCVVLALGERLARADGDLLSDLLRTIATDDRWRVREAVARGLQRVGDRDPGRLNDLVLAWARSSDPLVQRAAAAAICEPRLLRSREAAGVAREVCALTTRSLEAQPGEQRRDPALRVLRQALGYCWSVAVAADPEAGLPEFAALESSGDPDVAWIVRENRKKARLQRILE